MPAVETEAPAFELKDQSGATVDSRELKGKWVVLYFYPKDNTPGCTKEACNFRDNYGAIKAKGAVVLGVSGDSEASHQKFRSKYELPFQLLADPGNEVARAYGAWGTKQNYGKTYEGIIRSTFVIDPAGRVAKVWKRVKPDAHGEEVLNWLTEHAS
ncbi:MAG: thioredoxin-dependent thiol peroxidase [Dehalococcoidia bacterium]